MITTKQRLTAFDEGYKQYFSGEKIAMNPYTDETLMVEWYMGFDRANRSDAPRREINHKLVNIKNEIYHIIEEISNIAYETR